MFARHLRALRTKASLTMNDIGVALGCSRFTVFNWEAGRTAISAQNLDRYLDAVGASAEDRAEALRLAGEHAVPPDVADTSPFGANGPSPVITGKRAVPELSATNEHTAPTTSAPHPAVLSGVCQACQGRGQVAGDDCDACDCTGRVLLISGDEAVDAA